MHPFIDINGGRQSLFMRGRIERKEVKKKKGERIGEWGIFVQEGGLCEHISSIIILSESKTHSLKNNKCKFSERIPLPNY